MGSTGVAQAFKPVTIQVSEQITNEFKAKAKEVFPNEAFAYLLGHADDDKFIIDSLFYPTDCDSHCTPHHVHVQADWRTQAKREAKRTNTEILGDIHSHPYVYNGKKGSRLCDTSPSETDWDSVHDGEITGICVVQQIKDKRLRARVKYWGPMAQVKLKHTK
jgi:Prokaryotic homologs of the JAB domain